MRRSICHVLVALCCSVAGQAAVLRSREAPRTEGALVEAEVISAQEQPPIWVMARLKVRHVFAGASQLVGRTFSARSVSQRAGKRAVGRELYPPLTLGEVGIWLLDSDQRLGLRPRYSRRYGVRWPVRKVPGRSYDKARALAQAVERVSRSGPGDRLNLLRTYARDESPEVASWAVHAIAEAKPKGLEEFLDGLLAGGRLCVGGQVALDEVLCQLKRDEWIESPDRLRLLQAWVSGKRERHDLTIAISRLDVANQHRELHPGALLKLMRVAVANEDMPIPDRRTCLFLVGRAHPRIKGQAPKEKGELASYLIHQVESAEEEVLRHAAAYSLRNFVRLDQGQAARVAAIRAASKDTKLKPILQEALARSRAQGGHPHP